MAHAQNSGSPKADSAAAAAPAKKRGSEQDALEEGFDSTAAVGGTVCKRPRGSAYEPVETAVALAVQSNKGDEVDRLRAEIMALQQDAATLRSQLAHRDVTIQEMQRVAGRLQQAASAFGCPTLPFCFAVFSRQAAARMMAAKVAPLVPRSIFAQRVLPCRGVRVVGATIAPAERMMALGGGYVGMLALLMMGAGCSGVSRHAKRMMMSIVARVAAARSIATAEGAGLATLLLEGGRGIAKDHKRAFALAAAGARSGCLHCLGVLSNCYTEGCCVSKDGVKAFELGRESAAAGSCYGQVVVGWCYENGEGVAEDKVEAARFYRLAADEGLAEAQVHLACMFETGEGVAENKAEALRLYHLATEQGCTKAFFCLGDMFAFGEGVTRNPAEAVRLYRLAAEQGDADGMCGLACMYQKGEGVPQDHVEAVRLFRLAAEQQVDGFASFLLADCFWGGTGVPQDYAEAARLYRLSVELGFGLAAYALGLMLEDGLGVAQDLTEAIRMYRIAAADGDVNAQEALQRLGA